MNWDKLHVLWQWTQYTFTEEKCSHAHWILKLGDMYAKSIELYDIL